MSGIVFAIPGDLSLPTGGYAYDRRLLAEWRESGVAAGHLALPGAFPEPSAAELAAAGDLLLAQARDAVLLVDGLAYGAFPEALAQAIGPRCVALVHHPLGLETGLPPAAARRLIASEQVALRHAAAVVATSETTRRLLVAEFAVPAQRIMVAEPGVDPAERATGSSPGAPLHLLAVGAVVPRKGYGVLIEALAGLAALDWRLTIIGADDRDPALTQALRAQIAAAGLGGRVTMAGAVDASTLDAAYASADLFVMPSLFEGYGMVLTEAIARGLPILCTTGGAAAETAPSSVALKVAPGDVAALRDGLAALLTDPAGRRARAEAAWAAARSLPRWRQTAAIVAETCETLRR